MLASLRRRLLGWEGLLLLFLAVVLFYNLSTNPRYFEITNQVNLFTLGIEKSIVILVMAFVIMTGEIDLSVASMMGLAAAVVAALFESGVPMEIAVIVALAVGLGFGILNGILVAVVVVPLAAVFLRPPPQAPATSFAHHGPPKGTRVAGFSPNVALGLLSFAIFCCCMTMSMPMQHLVSFCGDLGIGATHGAVMLSVLMGSAFLARQFWGWLSDKVGGLRTILFGSIAQAIAMSGFLVTQNEVGLFTVSAAFGLGYARPHSQHHAA